MEAELASLVRLNDTHIRPAAEMLARAFHDEPLTIYFLPDYTDRQLHTSQFFQILVRYGVHYGEAYATSPNLEGVAVWFRSHKTITSAWRMIRCGAIPVLLRLTSDSIRRFWFFNKYASAVRKRHAPRYHWFLSPIGVDPLFQGRGYASTLLRPMLVRMDHEGLACYLDTQSEKNVAIYQHYGFKVVEEFRIPGANFNNWAMLREPSSFC